MPRSVGGYAAYMFKDKDPAIHSLRTAIEDEIGHRITKRDLKMVRYGGGPTPQTTDAMFFGETLRPRNATLDATGATYGLKRVWEADKGVKPSEKTLLKWRADHGVSTPRGVNGKNGKAKT